MNAQGFIHVVETVEAACTVKLQVAVQNTPLHAVESVQPFPPLRDGDAHLDKSKRLPRFGRSCKKHLVAFAKHSLDELIRKWRQIVPHCSQRFRIGKVVVQSGDPFHPFFIG